MMTESHNKQQQEEDGIQSGSRGSGFGRACGRCRRRRERPRRATPTRREEPRLDERHEGKAIGYRCHHCSPACHDRQGGQPSRWWGGRQVHCARAGFQDPTPSSKRGVARSRCWNAVTLPVSNSKWFQ